MRRLILLMTIILFAALWHQIACVNLDTDDEDDEDDDQVDCQAACEMHFQCLDPDHRVFDSLSACISSCENMDAPFGICVYGSDGLDDCYDWRPFWAQCLQSSQGYLGNCDTEDIYYAMVWLFEDCYEMVGDGYVMYAEDVCESSSSDLIDCFMDCYDAADSCGGSYDPLFDCLALCLDDQDDDMDDDYTDDDYTDDDYDGACEDIVDEFFYECAYTLSDLNGGQLDDLGLMEWCELSRAYVSAPDGTASPFWNCLGSCSADSCDESCLNDCFMTSGDSGCALDVSKVYLCNIVLIFDESDYWIPEMDAADACDQDEARWACYGQCADQFCPAGIEQAIDCMLVCDSVK